MIKSIDQHGTRERLFEAALHCFAERGHAATTTRAICARAGVNLALLSYHWGGKDALWTAVLRTLHERVAATILGSTADATELGDRVRVFLTAVARQVVADPRPLRVMLWAQLDPRPHDAEAAASYAPVALAGIHFLEEEQRAGNIAADIDVGLALVTFYGLVAEPLVEPAVHRTLFGVDGSDPAHRARIERHVVASGLRLLGLEPGRQG